MPTHEVDMSWNKNIIKFIKILIGIILFLVTIINIYFSVVTKIVTSTLIFHEYVDDRKLNLRHVPDIKICPILGFNQNGKLRMALESNSSKNLSPSDVEELIQSHVLKVEDFITGTWLGYNYFHGSNLSMFWTSQFTGIDYEGNCFTFDMMKGKGPFIFLPPFPIL